MKISDYLTKRQWSRRTIQNGVPIETFSISANAQMRKPMGTFQYFTQEKFMNELRSGAHIIYDCNYRSMRPKFRYDVEQAKNVLDGYEDVTRTAISWQEAIRTNKTSTCGGNPPWIGNESGPEYAEYVSKIKSNINVLNLQAALLAHFSAIMGTADGALYFYREGDEIKWKCFSFEEGDNCSVTRDREDP